MSNSEENPMKKSLRGADHNPVDPNSPENVKAQEALKKWLAEHAKHTNPPGTAIPDYEPRVVITPTMRREAAAKARRDPKD